MYFITNTSNKYLNQKTTKEQTNRTVEYLNIKRKEK